MSHSEVVSYTMQELGRLVLEQGRPVDKTAQAWNATHAERIFQILRAVQDFLRASQRRQVSVLNVSGLNGGMPDPVVVDLLAQEIGSTNVHWSVMDHPESKTFQDPVIRAWIDRRNIRLIETDHRTGKDGIQHDPVDVVLCTEIVEHLDYSDTVGLLRFCQSALKPGGILIITTPNLLFVGYRLMILLGYWDKLHFNDGPEHVDRGLVGHTIFYDGRRMSRLLRALGFEAVQANSFNVGHGGGEVGSIARKMSAVMLRQLSRLVPHSGQVLQVVARKPA